MVAGKIFVAVETSGSETATAKISQILNDTRWLQARIAAQGRTARRQGGDPDPLTIGVRRAGHDGPRRRGRRLEQRPRHRHPHGRASGDAQLDLALCANKGILVKDGRALELMNEVDTVLFDKTGTLTRERPEVGRVIAANGFARTRSCASPRPRSSRFHHPIALAILHKASAT